MKPKHSKYRSWRDKLEHPAVEGLPKVVEVPEKWRKIMGGRRVLVPTPMMADEEIRKVGDGQPLTVGQLRQRLAKRVNADSTCPLTLGIFLRIVSETAEEDRQNGRQPITPYWRVVMDDGRLRPKFPGGVEAQAERLRNEGHRIAPGKGKQPPRVADLQKLLA